MTGFAVRGLILGVLLGLVVVAQASPAEQLIWGGTPTKEAAVASFTLPEDALTGLIVRFKEPGAVINLTITSQFQPGLASYHFNTKLSLNAKSGLEQRIDRLPALPGEYRFAITGKGGEVEISAVPLAAIDPIFYGDELGELVITQVGDVTIKVDGGGVKVSHPDFKGAMMRGLRGPGGAIHYKLPAGYWRLTRAVRSHPEQAQLIPVHAGKRTRLDWKSAAPLDLSYADSAPAQRLLLREATSVSETEADIRFMLPSGLGKQEPEVEQFQITERGRNAQILGLESVAAPLHVVLLLDSSGSMKKQMSEVIQAATRFIQRLPDDAWVDVIDFDTRPKPMSASSRNALIETVKAIRADGATALRDTVMLGLDQFEGATRPALVLFTDGFDANYNDTAPGSKTTEQALFARVEAARIPIFSIGFGEGADAATLGRLADLSGGFYQAADAATLDRVFSNLEQSIAKEYRIRYRRPAVPKFADKSIVAITVDTSASMGGALSKGQPGSRFELSKEMLHTLVQQLPEGTLVQLLEYDDLSQVLQTVTHHKARLHQAIGLLKEGGGTQLLPALQATLEGVLSAPTQRRHLLFLTDEAIKVPEKDRISFERLLARMKDEKISSLWVGMVESKSEASFRSVAEQSGGAYVLARSVVDLEKILADLLEKVGTPSLDQRFPIQLIWQKPDSDVGAIPVVGNGLFPLPQVPFDETQSAELSDSLVLQIEPIRAGEAPMVSSGRSSAKVRSTGQATVKKSSAQASATGQDDALEWIQDQPARTLSYSQHASNTACRLEVTALALYGQLQGVAAPVGSQFAVFDVALRNQLPEQEVVIYPNGGSHPSSWIKSPPPGARVVKAIPPYRIQDLRQHLFLRWNGASLPVSPATWLFEDSLLPFGEHSLTVYPGVASRGKVVFVVPESGLDEAAMDLFDTAYGHLMVALAGKPQAVVDPMKPLARKVGQALGDAFELSITGMSDHSSPLAGATASDHLIWRIFDLQLDSRVEALLNIDPAKRFSLRVPTDKGPVQRPVSAVTALLPSGLYGKPRIAPGSANYFRQAYLLPRALADQAYGSLVVDMKGADRVIALDAPAPPAISSEWIAAGAGLKIRLNAHGLIHGVLDKTGKWYFVDATVEDERDGDATRLSNLFFLGRADRREHNFAEEAPPRGKKKEPVRIYADPVNSRLMFGAHSGAVVADGEQLRFVTALRLPDQGEYLLAATESSLQETLRQSTPRELPEWLLALDDEKIPVFSDGFDKALAARLKELARHQRHLNQPVGGGLMADENGISDIPPHLLPPEIAPHAPQDEAQTVLISVVIEAQPIGDSAGAQTGKAANALGGQSSQTRRFTLLNTKVPLAQLTPTPFEIYYVEHPDEAGKKAGEKGIAARISGRWGEETGRERLDPAQWKPLRERIVLTLQGTEWPVFERDLESAQLTERIHSIAAGLPDINTDQATQLDQTWRDRRIDETPDHLSLWRWYAHARLARFIIDQTRFEQKFAQELNVSLTRAKRPRLMALTGQTDSQSLNLEARLDLLSVLPEVAGAPDAVRAFRIANGFYLTQLEAQIMQGKGVFQYWGRNRLQLIPAKGKLKTRWLEYARKQGVSDKVLARIKKSSSVLLFPEVPAERHGEPFWAWLEIDPVSWELIGVLETGERGTIAGEAIIQSLIPDGAGVALGFMKGVESAVWAQSAFIIEGHDWETALDLTEKMLTGLAEHFGNIGDSFSVPVGGGEVDLLSGKFTLGGFSSDGTLAEWEGYKGFTSGFNMGVATWLANARAKTGDN